LSAANLRSLRPRRRRNAAGRLRHDTAAGSASDNSQAAQPRLSSTMTKRISGGALSSKPYCICAAPAPAMFIQSMVPLPATPHLRQG
jgi:hypothetical protein